MSLTPPAELFVLHVLMQMISSGNWVYARKTLNYDIPRDQKNALLHP